MRTRRWPPTWTTSCPRRASRRSTRSATWPSPRRTSRRPGRSGRTRRPAPATAADPMAITLDDLRGDRRRVRTERLVRSALAAAAATSILISALIIFSLARETWTYVTQVEWATVFRSDGWFPRRGEYNIWTLLVGSGIVTAVAMIVAVPVGLGSAIYLSEYARPSVRKVLKPTLEILAGIPSVVLGFFAISFISPEIVQRFFGATDLFNLMAAG